MYRHFHSKIAVLQEASEPLPPCNMSGMRIPAGQMIKHQRTTRCFKNTEMRLRRKDVEGASWCVEIEFNLIRKEVD